MEAHVSNQVVYALHPIEDLVRDGDAQPIFERDDKIDEEREVDSIFEKVSRRVNLRRQSPAHLVETVHDDACQLGFGHRHRPESIGSESHSRCASEWRQLFHDHCIIAMREQELYTFFRKGALPLGQRTRSPSGAQGARKGALLRCQLMRA